MTDLLPPLHVVEWTPPADHGRLPVRLLVHGTMDRASSFGRMAAALGDRTVVAYDRRGYASSTKRAATEDFDDQVEDLLEVLDERPAVAFGHSYGANVVLTAAAQHPEIVVGAVVWEPPMPWLPYWPTDNPVLSTTDPGDAAEAFMRRMVGDEIWERLPTTTRRRRREEGETLIAEMHTMRGGAPWEPRDIGVPVIVGTGATSRPYWRRGGADLAAALPFGRLAVIPGAGHGAHLTHPIEVAGLVREVESWLRTPPPSGEESATVERDDA
jgi:pimeloyl-ACP methyl ester carboxylesterase